MGLQGIGIPRLRQQLWYKVLAKRLWSLTKQDLPCSIFDTSNRLKSPGICCKGLIVGLHNIGMIPPFDLTYPTSHEIHEHGQHGSGS